MRSLTTRRTIGSEFYASSLSELLSANLAPRARWYLTTASGWQCSGVADGAGNLNEHPFECRDGSAYFPCSDLEFGALDDGKVLALNDPSSATIESAGLIMSAASSRPTIRFPIVLNRPSMVEMRVTVVVNASGVLLVRPMFTRTKDAVYLSHDSGSADLRPATMELYTARITDGTDSFSAAVTPSTITDFRLALHLSQADNVYHMRSSMNTWGDQSDLVSTASVAISNGMNLADSDETFFVDLYCISAGGDMDVTIREIHVSDTGGQGFY